ncbi:MAG TPA: hypothetical protein VM529_00080 [Gemmata sp.]|nr:hypothetical protein [Gemmata sp.]
MRGVTRRGIGGVVAVAAVCAGFALSAPAQERPQLLPPGLTQPIPDLMPGPPAGEDPEVLPAQLLQPAGGEPRPGAPAARPVADPPPPVVRVQVRVPADSPPGDDIKYLVTVQNTSTADAHSVTVRNPLPEGAKAVKAEPAWDATSNDKQLVWKFGTLAAGKSKTIELTLRPDAKATEVRNLAYVSFEHGEAVTTRINKPAVKVTKVAPKQTVRDEPFTVRIAVDNTGKVPAEGVRVVENLPPTAEVEPVTKGAKRTDKRDAPPAPGGQQWVWEFPRLMPGERKVIEYRVTPREAKDLYSLTSLDAAKGLTDRAEARTQVLVPGLAVKLAGPTAGAPVNPGEPAKYEITVRNTGTMPSTNVRVTGNLPADCAPTKKTAGGTLYRDAIQWVIPRLEAGEAQTFRFEVKSGTTGRRVVVASVADARGQRAADEVATLFQGVAALVWESEPNPVALAVGKQGTFTVRVRNNGGEAARNVRVEIEVPDAVTAVQVTPKITLGSNKLVFGPETIPARGEAAYTLTYEAKQSAQAWFKLKMTADCLGDRPMETEKAVEITGGR